MAALDPPRPAWHPLEPQLQAGGTNPASLETLLRAGRELQGHNKLSAQLSLQRPAGADIGHPAPLSSLKSDEGAKNREHELSGTVLLGVPACFQPLEEVMC